MTTEERLLRSVIERPHDPMCRQVYADWLEELGDARAEFLRLEMELTAMPADHPGRGDAMARLKALWQELDADWLAAVNRSPVEGCRYRFKCPTRWTQLTETDDKAVRFCGECKREVFYCKSVDDARYYIQSGFCVAIDLHAERKAGDIEELEEEIGEIELDGLGSMTMGMLDDQLTPGEFEFEQRPRGRWWQFWKWGR